MGPFIYQSRKIGQLYTVSLEKGGLSYTWQRWKKVAILAHPYHVPPPPPPELLFYCARKASNKTNKVTGTDGHKLVWKAVASYLWMNVQPYLVDFYSDWPRYSVVMITDVFLIYINCLKVVITVWVPSWENTGLGLCITKMQVDICVHKVWMSDQHLI